MASGIGLEPSITRGQARRRLASDLRVRRLEERFRRLWVSRRPPPAEHMREEAPRLAEVGPVASWAVVRHSERHQDGIRKRHIDCAPRRDEDTVEENRTHAATGRPRIRRTINGHGERR